jgi:hypothetical protein
LARIRKIHRRPNPRRNYYLVDANFLARKHVPIRTVPAGSDRARVEACQEWWKEIDAQLDGDLARVYVPDICIAESFKILANWYYVQKWLNRPGDYKKARESLSSDIRTDTKALRTTFRPVRFHDISTNRDIIVSVDRFFEIFMKTGRIARCPT